MTNKIYSKIKEFIKENFVFLILPILVFTIFSIPLSFYVEAPGGIISLDNKIIVKDGNKINGSLNLTYVSMYDGNVGMYLLSKLNKTWDLVPSNNVQAVGETRSDAKVRNKVLLDNSLGNAYYVAYKNLNENNLTMPYDIKVLFVHENADTNIEVGDKILKIDDKEIKEVNDIFEYLSKKHIGDKLKIIVNDNKEKYAVIGSVDGVKSLLISIVCNYHYSDNVEFNFKGSESGPSGGLMIALSIYSQNIEDDLIRGRKIAGTGTIDIDGNVGEIGGIKHKIMGAVNQNVDVFLVPHDNYEEAKKIVEEYDYNINLISIKTFEDAINYLKK